ncbi:MAG: mechanosensitive ion channel family protein [Opitutales bacterium]|nr:mechanosensitive ion channel family protein [Opitutales bacterium]
MKQRFYIYFTAVIALLFAALSASAQNSAAKTAPAAANIETSAKASESSAAPGTTAAAKASAPAEDSLKQAEPAQGQSSAEPSAESAGKESAKPAQNGDAGGQKNSNEDLEKRRAELLAKIREYEARSEEIAQSIDASRNPNLAFSTRRAQSDAKLMHKMRKALFERITSAFPQSSGFLKGRTFGMWNMRWINIAAVAALALLLQFAISKTLNILSEILLKKFNAKSGVKFLARIRVPIRAYIIMAGVYYVIMSFANTPETVAFLGRIAWGVFALMGFLIIAAIGDFFIDAFSNKFISSGSARNLTELGRKLFKMGVGVMALLAVMDLCGANVNAVVASLGIGGAALAFASKDTIANFFGSISIVADRPFKAGDWIVANGVEGTVEQIGIRSTKIRTFAKTIVTYPNSELANLSIENLSRRTLRRCKFDIGLTYSTNSEQMREIVSDIKKILLSREDVSQDEIYVHFTEFGNSSLNISIIFYTPNLGYCAFNDTKQAINLAIMRAVESRGLSIAFPSMSVYIESEPKR